MRDWSSITILCCSGPDSTGAPNLMCNEDIWMMEELGLGRPFLCVASTLLDVSPTRWGGPAKLRWKSVDNSKPGEDGCLSGTVLFGAGPGRNFVASVSTLSISVSLWKGTLIRDFSGTRQMRMEMARNAKRSRLICSIEWTVVYLCSELELVPHENKVTATSPRHYRTSLFSMIMPLTRFGSTKQLVSALRDSLYGHQGLSACGLEHPDIGPHNIILVEGGQVQGLIRDFDYCVPHEQKGGNDYHPPTLAFRFSPSSYHLSSRTDTPCRRQQEGTYPQFMALDALRGKVHTQHHDFESFFWLLLWLVLRHVDPGRVESYLRCAQLFDEPDGVTAAGVKNGYLYTVGRERGKRVVVVGNEPLSWLLGEFVGLVADSTRKGLSYKVVLGLFGEALSLDGWPCGDHDAAVVVPVEASRKKRSR
ncbi:hypothetical protein AMATHDRAFT_7438 [Amanita thiersii Skay4041]|uniref:Fungal-type protein kinase domain-containing protein n=1 Tax=Amanita thiersii Skay4041 TaxID=703135 RepID=A0A2A9NBP6_9AGAR|nr:hypothetical protein AMATHDRAFT_7438 [Amanita thiersii Skay4041]